MNHTNMKIATINISGIKSPDRRRLLLNLCLTNGLDIVGLQEITFDHCSILESFYSIYTNLGADHNGTAILIRNGLNASEVRRHSSGRITSAKIENIYFTVIYAPSGNDNKALRDHFFRVDIPSHMMNTEKPDILAGDFNAVDGNEDRNRKTGARRRPIIEKALVEMITGLELIEGHERE